MQSRSICGDVTVLSRMCTQSVKKHGDESGEAKGFKFGL